MAVYHFVVFSVLLVAAHGLVRPATHCSGVSRDHCTVTEVRIEPCQVGKKQCTFVKGENAALSFDFTPNFSTENLKTAVYYNGAAFADMETDSACGLTTCPSVAGTSQTLNYTLYVGKKLPKGSFPINWKVWNGDNKEEVCCFQTTIKLKDPK